MYLHSKRTQFVCEGHSESQAGVGDRGLSLGIPTDDAGDKI